MKPPKDKMFLDNRARTALLKANVKAQKALLADPDGIKYFQLVGNPSLKETTTLIPADRQDIDISRGTTELKGFYPFLFFSLPWICTHLGDFIEEAGSDYYYINLTWEQYLGIALDKYTGLGDILERELNRFRHENANHAYKLINIDKNRIISMIPFIINIIYDDGSIDDLTKARLKALSKARGAERHKISEIHIYFSKYLFRPYKENVKNYKNLPKAIWAMALWNELQNEKIFKKHFDPIKRLIVIGDTEKTKNNIDNYADENPVVKKILPLYSQELRVTASGGKLVSRHSREYLSAYINFYLYLLGKDNGRGDYISIKDPVDFFLHVIPGMIDAIKRHDKPKKENYMRILKGAVAALDDWTGLDFTVDSFTETNGPKMRVYIDRNYLPPQYKGKKRKKEIKPREKGIKPST
jgi:hypothetical protein